MPVNTPHPTYTIQSRAWERIATCLDGSDSVKAAGPTYLPKITGQSDDKYNIYKDNALFFNASGRTHDAMIGFLFRKPPTINLPDPTLESLALDADLAGAALTSYARQVAYSAASTGRAGTVVDWSEEENRPYFAFYPERAILNWREERIGGKNQLTLLILQEGELIASTEDPYAVSLTVIYREFYLRDGVAYSQEWRQTNQGAKATTNAPGTGATAAGAAPKPFGEPKTLMRRGKALTFIPFVIHGCETTGLCIDKPPLGDITAVNISHYRTSADIENARHKLATPTPWAVGFGEDDKLFLGSDFAWTSNNTDARCGFLEFTGQGVPSLEKALEEKQGQMAALGARLIEPRSNDAEAYETVQLRASAETSTLARIGMLVSESLTAALRIADWWSGGGDELNNDVKFSLNSDFTSSGMRPDMLTALTAAYQQNIISKDVLYHQLSRGELYPDGWTKEAEWEAQDANPPLPPPGPPAPPKIDN